MENNFITPYRYTVFFKSCGGKIFKDGIELNIPKNSVGIEFGSMDKLSIEEVMSKLAGTEYIEKIQGEFKEANKYIYVIDENNLATEPSMSEEKHIELIKKIRNI